MKPAELIIQSINFINQSQCNVILKNDDVIETFGGLILIKDKNGDYAYSGFGSKIEYIFFEKDKIYPIFDIDKELYDDPDIMQKVRIAIAGAITEYCSSKDPENYTIIEVADYKPELETDKNGNRLRLAPSTKIVNKILPFEDSIKHLKKKLLTFKSEEAKESLRHSIEILYKYKDDVIMPTEVPINAQDKDGDIFVYPDEQDDLVESTDGCKKEKLSLDELSKNNTSRCQSAKSSFCETSDTPKAKLQNP